MSREELRAALEAEQMSAQAFARTWRVGERAVRRWLAGEREVPPWVPVALEATRRGYSPPAS